jgi:hypothetical protein
MTLGFASGLYGKKHIAEHGDVFFIMPLAGLARAAQGQAYYALTLQFTEAQTNEA